MPCGVLLESGGLADVIPDLLDKLEEPSGSRVIYDTDPERLVKRIVKILDDESKDLKLGKVKEEWMIKASICDPLAGKHGFKKGKTDTKRTG